jgi:hypothetical protein
LRGASVYYTDVGYTFYHVRYVRHPESIAGNHYAERAGTSWDVKKHSATSYHDVKDYAKGCKIVLGNCFGPFPSSREEKLCQIAEVVLRFHIILKIRLVHPLG